MAESASEAMGRATQVVVDAVRDEARAADRRVLDRIISEDEKGRRRRPDELGARAALAAVADDAVEEWGKRPDQLVRGEYVRVGGTFFRFEELVDGKMRLFLGDHEFTFGADPGRRYQFHGPAF